MRNLAEVWEPYTCTVEPSDHLALIRGFVDFSKNEGHKHTLHRHTRMSIESGSQTKKGLQNISHKAYQPKELCTSDKYLPISPKK